MVHTEESVLEMYDVLVSLSRCHAKGTLFVATEAVGHGAGVDGHTTLTTLRDAEGMEYCHFDSKRNGWRLHDGVVVGVMRQSNCDVCHYYENNTEVKAIADARLAGGRWGNVCARHFVEHADRLGLGFGQFLRLEY